MGTYGFSTIQAYDRTRGAAYSVGVATWSNGPEDMWVALRDALHPPTGLGPKLACRKTKLKVPIFAVGAYPPFVAKGNKIPDGTSSPKEKLAKEKKLPDDSLAKAKEKLAKDSK